jgi:hypothetical protein
MFAGRFGKAARPAAGAPRARRGINLRRGAGLRHSSSLGRGATGVVPGAPALASVNLMPPVFRAKACHRAIARRGAVWLLGLFAVLGGVLGIAVAHERVVQAGLARVQASTAALDAEAGRYAQVTQKLNGVKVESDAVLSVMGYEVDWNAVISRIEDTLPAGAKLTNLTLTGVAPGNSLANVGGGGASAPPGDTSRSEIGQVTFSMSVPGLPDISAWLAAVDAQPGFSGASYSTATLGGSGGSATYTINATALLDIRALSGQYKAGADGVLDTGRLDPSSSPTATGTAAPGGGH